MINNKPVALDDGAGSSCTGVEESWSASVKPEGSCGYSLIVMYRHNRVMYLQQRH